MFAVYCQSLPSHSATQPSEPHDRTAYQVQTPEQVGLLELDEDELDEDGGLLELDEDELDELDEDELDEDGGLLLDDDGGLLLEEQPIGVGSLMYQ